MIKITNDIEESSPRPMFGLQVGLRQLFLTTLCVGVWIAHWTNQDGIARLEPRLANLHRLSPELDVADPNKIAVVQKTSSWFNVRCWEIYVPTDTVRICLATNAIYPSGYPQVYESYLLPKGQWFIQLEDQVESGGHRYVVTRNDQPCFTIVEGGRTSGGGSSTSSDVSFETKQVDDKVPIDLSRCRFTVPVPGSPGSTHTPTGPAEGFLLWIQSE